MYRSLLGRVRMYFEAKNKRPKITLFFMHVDPVGCFFAKCMYFPTGFSNQSNKGQLLTRQLDVWHRLHLFLSLVYIEKLVV